MDTEMKEFINLRFSNESLPTYSIITNDSVFTETYLSGDIRRNKMSKNDKNVRYCSTLSGFVLYFQIDSNIVIADIYKSHFRNLYTRYLGNDIQKVKNDIENTTNQTIDELKANFFNWEIRKNSPK